jgi:hypothetical protein
MLLALLALAACQNQPQATNNVTEEQRRAEAPVKDVDAIPADETAAAAVGEGDGAPAAASAVTHIPEQFWGRWGMTAADCDPARSDNKGLLRIDDNRLYFYESRATLDRIIAAAPGRFEAMFGFGGEGQEWTSKVTLTVQGDTLTREEEGPRLTYKRCP